MKTILKITYLIYLSALVVGATVLTMYHGETGTTILIYITAAFLMVIGWVAMVTIGEP